MNLEQFHNKIESEIGELQFGEPRELYDPIIFIMEKGGKRLRPLLCLLSYNLFASDWQSIIKPALGVEVFHNFTLMHDDIMDKAPLRRGRQTIHEKWNPNIAILSGDVMFVKAYELLMSVEKELVSDVLTNFNRCATHVCEGQQEDMNFETQSSVSVEDYLQMIKKKTAELLGFSVQLGGILAKQNEATLKGLYEFGVNLGLAFQLQDDLLDAYGDTSFGKQRGGDIITNKKTFLLIKALEKSEGETLKALKDWLDKNEFNSEEKVEAIISIYDKLDIKQEAETMIHEFTESATRELGKIQGNIEALELLEGFTHSLKSREK